MSAGGMADSADALSIESVFVRVFPKPVQGGMAVFDLGGEGRIGSKPVGDAGDREAVRHKTEANCRPLGCLPRLCLPPPFFVHEGGVWDPDTKKAGGKIHRPFADRVPGQALFFARRRIAAPVRAIEPKSTA